MWLFKLLDIVNVEINVWRRIQKVTWQNDYGVIYSSNQKKKTGMQIFAIFVYVLKHTEKQKFERQICRMSLIKRKVIEKESSKIYSW